jgi:hypothetical protein
MSAFASSLQEWFRGEDSCEAHAAGIAVATLLECARQMIVKE